MSRLRFVLPAVALTVALSACGDKTIEGPPMTHSQATPDPAPLGTATFGQGCYWCAEAVFQRLEGVLTVESGFSGGRSENPTYEEVCSGRSGHVEVIQVRYDTSKIRFEELLEVFWRTHDPTTPNRQGNDVGEQYRSVIFYHDEHQKTVSTTYREKLDAASAFGAPIVTTIEPFTRFWKADEGHQDYFNRNRDKGYCRAVIAPKVEKFEKVFREKLKGVPK